MTGPSLRSRLESFVVDYSDSQLAALIEQTGPYAIKFVNTRWAAHYSSPGQLKISETPALTWGTATYVTPIAFPLSSALYGRIGLVTDFDPGGWRVFDATDAAARLAYISWVRAQPIFSDLVLTVHSTYANHLLRNQFREDFSIDCVLFNPDQEAEVHTDRSQHIWMAVTDWTAAHRIDSHLSGRLAHARFTVLLDEEFLLEANGLPIQRAGRQIESVTERIASTECVEVSSARLDPALPAHIINHYNTGGYLHVFIEP